MINALDPKRVIGFIAVSVLIFFAGASLVLQMVHPLETDASPWPRVWDAARLAFALLNLLFLLMTWPPAFRLIYAATFAEHWWFPQVGGEWRGELKSNWPRVQAMMEAARGNRGQFDTAKDDIDPLKVKLSARIECELMAIRIVITMDGVERTSRTIFVRPERKAGEEPALYYIYRQTDHGTPAVTDTREHLGAAILRLDSNGDLKGKYWTARNEERGLTTAGTIALKRYKTRKRDKTTST